jgi:hypothetical protein
MTSMKNTPPKSIYIPKESVVVETGRKNPEKAANIPANVALFGFLVSAMLKAAVKGGSADITNTNTTCAALKSPRKVNNFIPTAARIEVSGIQ